MAEQHKDTILQQGTKTDASQAPIINQQGKPGKSRFSLANIEEREYSEQEYKELSQLYERTFTNIQESQIVKGMIVAITDNSVAIDIGFKSEGLVSITEFPNIDELKPGDEIEVFLESVENKDGQLVLSRKRADFMRTWEKIVDAYNKSEVLQGKITRRIKGGLVVDLMGLDAFLPGSQIDIKPVRDFDQFIGKTMEFKVAKINHPNENVVVSHKVLIEAEMHEQRSAILNSLEKGQILEGTAKAITDFGVFVDLGGVDGLVHITDLSWGRINHPSEVVKLDQSITVVVIDFDETKKRISLGLKQLQPHPWENIEDKYPVGTKVTGKVVSLADYGAFIEIEKGIEGLIHISEMSWTQHIKHPSQMVSMGQMIDAIILSLDKENKKISLGMKQLEPDPWLTLLQKENPWDSFAEAYKVGTETSGKIVRLIEKGVIVELPFGVDGFVPASQLSMTPLKNIAEAFHVNDEIPLNVVEFDKDSKKIVLSAVEYLKHKEQKTIDEYVAKHKLPPMTLKEVAEMPPKPIEAPPEEFTEPPTSDFMV
ncbi:MAG: 30S ribosomal protein S1 [Ignavibacteriales bacterium]|nr:30S ribosomal protein S1 [Ignavibacteriales bacterium]